MNRRTVALVLLSGVAVAACTPRASDGTSAPTARAPVATTTEPDTTATTTSPTAQPDEPPASQRLVVEFAASDGAAGEVVEVIIEDATGATVQRIDDTIDAEPGDSLLLGITDVAPGDHSVVATVELEADTCEATITVDDGPARGRVTTGAGCVVILDTPWFDGDTPIPASWMSETPGPGHCGWESATFLRWDDHTYVRDPERVFPREHFIVREQAEQLGWLGVQHLLGDVTDSTQPRQPVPTLSEPPRFLTFAILDALPADAVETGLTRGDTSLWRSPDGGYLYTQRGDHIERWPEASIPPLCA